MLGEQTHWPRLYAIAVLLGAGFGLRSSLGVLASGPDLPALATIAGGALTGLLLAAAARLGVRLQSGRQGLGR